MSMNIQRFVCNPLRENCYVVSDDTGEAIIVDCGAFYEEERRAVCDYIRNNNLTLTHLIATHGHADHNFGNDTIEAEFGIKVEVSADDEHFMKTLAEQAAYFAGITIDNNRYHTGRYFSAGETISFGHHTLEIIATPGHTPGSVFFYSKDEHLAFSGDTLFKMSIGRTDFELGSYSDIIDSLHRIGRMLPPDTVILPGHGPSTTMKDELANNPYMK